MNRDRFGTGSIKMVVLMPFIIFLFSFELYSSEVLQLNDSMPVPEIAAYTYICRDAGRVMTISHFLNHSEMTPFMKNDRKDMNFGFDPDVIWLKLNVRNVSDSLKHWILRINYPSLEDVQVYLVHDRIILSNMIKGIGNNQKYRGFDQLDPSFELLLGQGRIYEIYIRIRSTSVKIVPIDFIPIYKHPSYNLLYIFTEIALFGFIIGFIVYTLLLFFLTKSGNFLFLGVSYLFVLIGFLGRFGYLMMLVPWIPDFLQTRVLIVSLSLSHVFYILFSVHFLNIKQQNKKLINLSMVFQAIYLIVLILAFLPYTNQLGLSYLFLANYIAVWGLFYFLGFYSVQKGTRLVWYYLSTIILFTAVTFIYLLVIFGLIPFNRFLFHLSLYAICINAVILVVGLSRKMNITTKDKLLADELARNYERLKTEIELRQKIELELVGNQEVLKEIYNRQSVQLAEKENHFKYLIENLSDWVWQVNHEMRFTNNNYKLIKLLGYHGEELFDQSILDYTEIHDRERLEMAMKECLMNGKGFIDIPVNLIARNRKIIQMEISGEAIRDHDSAIVGLLGISRDLRQKHLSENLLLKAIHGAEEKERKRLSTEIHDGIGPILSGIQLYLGILLNGNLSREKFLLLLEKAKLSVQDVSNELRNISNNLYPVEFINRSLVENILLLTGRLSSDNDLSISIDSTDYTATLCDEHNLVVYRIVSELLNNTIKHARASQISIVFKNDPQYIRMTYTDNGIGLNSAEKLMSSTGGLRNIQSRIKTIDATCEITSAPGEGMILDLSFKYLPEQDVPTDPLTGLQVLD